MPAQLSPPPVSSPKRTFGRFVLQRLLGRSTGVMVWLAFDPRDDQELMLTLPRVAPPSPAALEQWLIDARHAARLDHPNLAKVAEVGVQDNWPFIAVERGLGVTLGEWMATHRNSPVDEVVGWIAKLLSGLAYAHEAGVAHHDPQLHSVLIDDRGMVRLMALAASGDPLTARRLAAQRPTPDRTMAMDPGELRERRRAAGRDLLACGLLLHCVLTEQAPLDEPDTALAINRITPLGREVVRLPWTTPLPIPEGLRAIANRSTSSQERLRYQNARTLIGALNGWLHDQARDGGGPLDILLDRLGSVGHLPALPGLAARVARVTSVEGQRTDQIAEQVLDDMALSFELLRTLNSAQVQGTQVQGNGPVLTLKRVIALIGVNGVRLAANTLRTWPGPLDEAQAAALQTTVDRVRLAGHTAQALRPAGYDAQVIFLITLLQNLGRLMLRYHFADEAEQIEQLMRTQAAGREAGAREQPGMSEEGASFAVLGVEVEALAGVVARHWGLSDDVMHMARRLPAQTAVRKPDTDAEVLRLTASCANEAVDAAGDLAPGPRLSLAINPIAQRYGRALGFGTRDIIDAMQAARKRVREGTPMPPVAREAIVPAVDASEMSDGLGAAIEPTMARS